ncbi:MAG TPA: HlyD family efflux transporter periplasmic adaptor subunit [Chitinophagaceae bacterium]|jgi:HlyD family secretion protein|nr:HlyD family efflux transporter periplasmic adaptor subunit [Chitinophagaceae bacterium]
MSEKKIQVTQGEIDKIELRSEEVRDILGSMPHWTIRSGSVYLLLLTIVALGMTWFIKYPDVIHAPFMLTTQSPPVSIMAESTGPLVVWAKNGERFESGSYLGYIKNDANVDSVISLINRVRHFKETFYNDVPALENFPGQEGFGLGQIQSEFNSFIHDLKEYQFFIAQKSFQKQINGIRNQAKQYVLLEEQIVRQNEIILEETKLATWRFRMDSVLYQQKVLSDADFAERRAELLRNQRAYKIAETNLTNNSIQATQLENRISELQQEEGRQINNFLISIEISMKQLENKLKEWEHTYMLKTPVPGRVAFFKYWANDQYVKTGEDIFTVIPDNQAYVGYAKAAIAGSGKIKVGQKVNIMFGNYPVNEFGFVTGIVKDISLVPKENNYNISIDFPEGLTTSYDKKLEFKAEMTGNASIITEDLKLFERIFGRIRRLFE